MIVFVFEFGFVFGFVSDLGWIGFKFEFYYVCLLSLGSSSVLGIYKERAVVQVRR